MNIGDILPADDMDQPATLHLVHPVTGDDLYVGDQPVSITLRGMESKIATEIVKKRSQKMLNNRGKSTVAEIEQFSLSLYAQLATGWNAVYDNDEPLEFNRQNLIDILSKHKWIREQIDGFISDRSNFTKS